MNVKEFKTRWLRGYIQPDLFKLPLKSESVKKIRCSFNFKTYQTYDIANNSWLGERYTFVSFVIVDYKNKVVFNSKKNTYGSYGITLQAGKYKLKIIFSLQCKITSNWQEFIVNNIDDTQNFTFFLEGQDFYKVKVRIDEDKSIPAIILQNKNLTKRTTEITEAYGKGIIYTDFYNYFTNELVFSTPTIDSTCIYKQDLSYSYSVTTDDFGNMAVTDILLYARPQKSSYFSVTYKDGFNNIIQIFNITENSCEKRHYSWSYIDDKSITSPISNIHTDKNGNTSIIRGGVRWKTGGSTTGRDYYNSLINITTTYPQEAYINGVGIRRFSEYCYSLLLYLQLAVKSNFSDENYNGYYSAIYCPYDEQGNCSVYDIVEIDSYEKYVQLINKYGETYDKQSLIINKDREIPYEIINTNNFKMAKKYHASILTMGAYELKLPDGSIYGCKTVPDILKDEITQEEYFYDNTAIPQYSDDYEYWINQ